jgi:hypothetical protein
VSDTSRLSTNATPAGFQKTASAPEARTLYASPIAVARAHGITFRNCMEVLPTFCENAFDENKRTAKNGKRYDLMFFIALMSFNEL